MNINANIENGELKIDLDWGKFGGSFTFNIGDKTATHTTPPQAGDKDVPLMSGYQQPKFPDDTLKPPAIFARKPRIVEESEVLKKPDDETLQNWYLGGMGNMADTKQKGVESAARLKHRDASVDKFSKDLADIEFDVLPKVKESVLKMFDGFVAKDRILFEIGHINGHRPDDFYAKPTHETEFCYCDKDDTKFLILVQFKVNCGRASQVLPMFGVTGLYSGKENFTFSIPEEFIKRCSKWSKEIQEHVSQKALDNAPEEVQKLFKTNLISLDSMIRSNLLNNKDYAGLATYKATASPQIKRQSFPVLDVAASKGGVEEIVPAVASTSICEADLDQLKKIDEEVQEKFHKEGEENAIESNEKSD